MANPKLAVVTRTEPVGPHARWLELELGEPLGFSGGQYVIVDSGLLRPNGKAAKRAYSMLTSDAEQRRIQLVVKRIPDGLSSEFMHRLRPGDGVKLSGPWGKLGAPSAEGILAAEPAGPRVLVLATDTGISAAIGLVRSARFRPLLPHTLLLWSRVSEADFVTDAFVREHVPHGCELRARPLPPVHHPERLPQARAMLAGILDGSRIEHARLAGDGVINYGLMSDFAARGVTLGRDDVESFFNMPLKSA